MSFWYEPKSKDLSYSIDGKDLHIYIGSDDSGSIYVSLPVEEVKKFLKKTPPTMQYPKETRWTPKKK